MVPIRILVVDDHPLMRRGLCSQINLESDMKVVGEAKNGIEAIEKTVELKPDVILMDLVMPQLDGIKAITEIKSKKPDTRILVLTSFSEDDRILAAIKAGAMGYILKETYPEDLLNAIRDVYAEKPTMSINVARKLFKEIRESQEQVFESPDHSLSLREIEVLNILSTGASNKEISEKLNICQGTVRSHVSNILTKLNLENRSQVILYAVQHGIGNNRIIN